MSEENKIKKVIIFGATGRTGQSIIKQSLAANLDVTLYVRNPERVPKEHDGAVKIIIGDVLDKESVEKAIEGQDAVLSTIGGGISFRTTTLISDGCKNILSGMKIHGVKKIVVVSVSFLLPGRSAFFFLKKVTEDHDRQISALKEVSDSIDWIAVAAPRIVKDETINDTYSVEKDDLTGVNSSTTAEIADFMVKVLNNEEQFNEMNHSLVGISSRPKKKGWWS